MRVRSMFCVIPMGRLLLAAAAGGVLLATNAFAQSAREATPYLAIENEPPPKLIVDSDRGRLPRQHTCKSHIASCIFGLGWRLNSTTITLVQERKSNG
jgi:hypothetical protein